MAGAASRSAIAWSRLQETGIGSNRPCFRSISPASTVTTQDKSEKVPIQWGSILQNALNILGGSEAVYTHERSNDMFQVRVNFRVPVDKSRNMFEDVEVHGIRCPEPWLAESTAGIAALKEFECAPFHAQIIDASCLRCEEMDKTCDKLLVKAGEVYRGVKLLLSDWEDGMEKTEEFYKGLYEEVVQDECRRTNDAYTEILFDVAHRMYVLNRASYLKYKKLFVESKYIKGAEWDVRSRSENRLRSPCHDRSQWRRGAFPREIKICMKIVLQEMISSLGWEKQIYRVTRRGTSLFMCEIVLSWKRDELLPGKKTVTIAGVEGPSEGDAEENASQSAVLFLDSEIMLRSIDVNYTKRSHAEIYLLEAREVASRAVSLGARILVEWENMVDGIHVCEEYCWTVMMEHLEKEPWNQMYNLKCRCAADVSHLHASRLADLVRGKERHRLLSTWIEQ